MARLRRAHSAKISASEKAANGSPFFLLAMRKILPPGEVAGERDEAQYGNNSDGGDYGNGEWNVDGESWHLGYGLLHIAAMCKCEANAHSSHVSNTETQKSNHGFTRMSVDKGE